MSTKKTPAKKTAVKSDKLKWKQTGEANVPGLGVVRQYDVSLPEDTSIRFIDALIQENKELKAMLTPPPEPQVKTEPLKPKSRNINDLLDAFEMQLSRFYNGMNSLDQFANCLKSTPSAVEETKVNGPNAPSDVFGKLEYLLQTFNHLNNRLETTNSCLGEII